MLPDPVADVRELRMLGLEADNLLAFLALLGLLRSLETSQPKWRHRAFWKGPPWVAHLILTQTAAHAAVAQAANQGIRLIASDFDVDNRKNVDFDREDYRQYVARVLKNNREVCVALASALTSECSSKRDRLQASPLVMMFGQGHQSFLERLASVVDDQQMTDEKILDALFNPWRRDDNSEGFRWDPEDDQRYAFRHGNPSKAGAAPTVAGANRLAAIGFLSFPTVPREGRISSPGTAYDLETYFVWPIWTTPLSRGCIEALLNHPSILGGNLSKVRLLGAAEIFRAWRVANGKYMNVTRARPRSVV